MVNFFPILCFCFGVFWICLYQKFRFSHQFLFYFSHSLSLCVCVQAFYVNGAFSGHVPYSSLLDSIYFILFCSFACGFLSIVKASIVSMTEHTQSVFYYIYIHLVDLMAFYIVTALYTYFGLGNAYSME